MGEDWLQVNPFLLPSKAASWFGTVVMDFTWSVDITKLLVRTFVHLALFTWEELSAELDRYNIFAGVQWLGGFRVRIRCFKNLLLAQFSSS
ncbi:hypothetical protein SUGI_0008400 [Cryptomeria japonica]|nr:hypothetical protein SUGI_0008400 [Cryptomeria japonica]